MIGLRLRLQILLAALASHRSRSLLASAMVSIGIAATLIMIGLSTGVRLELQALEERTGRNLFLVRAGERPVPVGRGNGWFITSRLKPEEATLIAQQTRYVRAVAPIIERSLPAKLENAGLVTTVRGVTPAYFELRNFEVDEGRAFDTADRQQLRRVAIVGAFIAERLNAGRSLVGERLWLGSVPFEIVGQLRPKGLGSDGSNEDDQVLVPLETALRRVANTDYVSQIIVQAQDAQRMDGAMRLSRDLLRRSHQLDEGARDDFDVLTMIRADEVRRLSSEWLQALSRILAGLSLGIGGAGVLAVCYLNVKDRMGEIGLRMAVGATRTSIASLFLAEACILSVLGGMAGILLGAVAGAALRAATSWDVAVDLRGILIPLGVSALIGIVFGVGPAVRASFLLPAAALSGE
jgi:putative ABC transport system permease protein